MAVKVTIVPHVVRCASTGEDVAFEQLQIFLGQRVVGYLAKRPGAVPSLVVKSLPEECVNAINQAAQEFNGGDAVAAAASQPIGAKPAKADAPPVDLAASSELEAALEADADKK